MHAIFNGPCEVALEQITSITWVAFEPWYGKMASATAGQVAVGTPGLDRILTDIQSKNKEVRSRAAQDLKEILTILLRGMIGKSSRQYHLRH